jgi:hypothetical protein
MATRLLILVCEGPTCADRQGSRPLRLRLLAGLAAHGLTEGAAVESEICFGHCQRGPNLVVCPLQDGEDEASLALLRRLGPAAPGAVVHHAVDEARLEQILTQRKLEVAAATKVA